MGNTRDTGYLRNLVIYDGSGNITLPANLTVTGTITGYATTSYVTTQISNLINGAPGLLDTLDELAAALGDDANFAATLTTSLSGKQSTITLTTTGTSGAATFVSNTLNIPNYGSALSGYLPLTGGTLTGALSGTSATFSGNVGIGTASPSSYTNLTTLTINGTNGSVIDLKTGNTLYGEIYSLTNELRIDAVGASSVLKFLTNSATRMTLDASGNVGIGATPSAWSDFKVLEFANGVYLGTYTGGGQTMYLGANNYFNGTDYIYKVSAYATRYQQASGVHAWYTSTISGTEGNVASFNQSMALTAAGRLLINTPTESTYQLDVNGTGRFAASYTASGTVAIETWQRSGGAVSADMTYNDANTSMNFGTSSSHTLNIKTNNTTALSIDSTGAATFSGAVNLTSLFPVFTIQGTVSSPHIGSTWSVSANQDGVGRTIIGTAGQARAMYFENNGDIVIPNNSLSGTSATFSGDITSGGASQNLFIANGSTYSGLKLQRGGADKWAIFNNNAGTDFLDFYWYGSSPGTKFKIEPTGAATFSSSVTATNGLFSNSGNSLAITTTANSTTYMSVGINSGANKSIFGYDVTDGGFVGTITNDDFTIRSNNAKRVTIAASTGAATFSSSVTATQFQLSAASGQYYYFDNGSGNNFLGLTATNTLGLYVGGNLSLSVDSTGAATFSEALSGTSATFSGAVSKGSGSFRIEHPLPSLSETHQLVHSFVESPQADLIYRGKLTLVNGKAQANIDEVSTMTEGTFEVLCREVQCFTTNESGWDLIKGKVIGNIIYIESQNETSADEISWMVIGERKDKHMMETEWTDENGKVIVEPLKPIEPEPVEEVEPTPSDDDLE